MATPTALTPYGTWSSPITAEFITQTTVSLGSLTFGKSTKSLFWNEARSSEGGRNVVCRHQSSNDQQENNKCLDIISERNGIDVNPKTSNVRTRVHEYGGAAFFIDIDPTNNKETLFYSNFSDQRLYKVPTTNEVEVLPICLTPENVFFNKDNLYRFADGILDMKRNRIICIREDHSDPAPSGVVNTIVSILLDGSGTMEVIASGNDFYTNPRLSKCGNQLAYVSWNHPNMPWDSTQLIVQNLLSKEEFIIAGNTKKEGGGGGEEEELSDSNQFQSVMQPLWNPKNGDLYFISDRQNGFWNIFKIIDSGNSIVDESWSDKVSSVMEKETDFCGPTPGWRMGQQGFNFIEETGALITSYSYGKSEQMKMSTTTTTAAAAAAAEDVVPVEGSVETSDNGTASNTILVMIDLEGNIAEFTQSLGLPPHFGGIVIGENKSLYMIVSSCSKPTSICRWDGLCTNNTPSYVAYELIASSMPLESIPQDGFIAQPEPIKFPTGDASSNEVCYGYYYPPRNINYEKTIPAGELPPLLVKAHGGPTSCTNTDFNPGIQFWTSRGFGVLDVDYRGSTGYGRNYRQKLNLNWGITDVEDAVAGANFLVSRGSVDVKRLCIDGRSAGGLTTLGALAFKDTFTAGCSLYGVADLSALAEETHKFESKYIVGLIGRWPEDEEIYRTRSPINAVDQLNCPVLLLHGDSDKIVPTNQAQSMYEVLLKKGIPTALRIYEGEQHGFRRSENIQDALYSELFFYSKVFGFPAGGDIPSFHIDNM